MHAADTEVVRRTRAAEPGQWLDYLLAKLTAAGAPDDHLAPLRKARATGNGRKLPGRMGRTAGPRHRPRRTARPAGAPGTRHLDARPHPRPCVPPPGGGAPSARTPGFGRLFSGDHLLPGITPHIGLYEAPDEEGSARHARRGELRGGRRPLGRLSRLPRTRRPARPRRGAARPPARLHRRRMAGCATSSPTTKSGWPSSGHCSRNRAPSGSSPWPWSGTARGSRSLTAPAISLSPRPRPICAVW